MLRPIASRALKAFDYIFGSKVAKRLLRALFGFRYFYVFIHLTRYRATHMVSSGDTCILAGVFYTETVLDYSRAVGPDGKVVIVEANPENILRLSSAVDAPNVVFINNAVWNTEGEMPFIASDGHEQGYNRLDDIALQKFPYHMDPEPKTLTVDTATLDNIAKRVGADAISHINLTINGAELQALDGIGEIMAASNDLRIYINSEDPDPAQAVIQKLIAMGFRVYTSRLITTHNKSIRLIRIYAT